jgi:hypothetical protein
MTQDAMLYIFVLRKVTESNDNSLDFVIFEANFGNGNFEREMSQFDI